MLVEWLAKGKASALGVASGAVAGLVVITPASGFVDPKSALIMGLLAGVVCYWGATALKRMFGYDDSLDAFGVHGTGGILGALLTGVFASKEIGGALVKDSMSEQLWVQAEATLATIAFSAVATYILLKLVDLVIGLRVSEEEEREGLDVTQHGERVE